MYVFLFLFFSLLTYFPLSHSSPISLFLTPRLFSFFSLLAFAGAYVFYLELHFSSLTRVLFDAVDDVE